jgi:uncharacterized protein
MMNLARLLPKEEKFFNYLQKLSKDAHDSAKHLKTFVENGDAGTRNKAAAEISACRVQSKNTSGEVTKELCLTFITPFDREDIQSLATELYKIPKAIEKIKDRLELYKLASRKGDLSRQTDLIVQEALSMEDMIQALTHGGKSDFVLQKVGLMQELENKGDAVLDDLLTSLFNDTADARDLIARKDIYDMLEKVIDCYRNAANIAMQIVLKNS